MGGKSLATIIGGIVTYAVSAIVVVTMITGTSAGDNLISGYIPCSPGCCSCNGSSQDDIRQELRKNLPRNYN